MTTTNHDETEQTPHQRAKRSRGEPKLYISFLPEGKGGPREDKGSVPLEVDVEAHIEERTDCEPGIYRIEKKRSGEFSGEVLFYSKDDAEPETSSTIGDLDDVDLPPPGSDIDVRTIVASTVNAVLDARDRRDRATAGQPDPMQQFREMRELLKEERDSGSSNQQDPIAMFERLAELQRKLTPPPPEPADTLSAKDRAQLMLVNESGLIPAFMRSMKDMLRAPEDATEPKGLFEKALEYFSGWTPYLAPALAPVVSQKIGEVVARVNAEAIAQRMNRQAGGPATAAGSATTPSGPAPQVLPAAARAAAPTNGAPAMSEQEAVALEVVVAQMRGYEKDEDPERLEERVATAVGALCTLPGETLSLLVSTPTAFLLAYLSQLKPEWEDVANMADAGVFVNALREALLGGGPQEEASADNGEAETSPEIAKEVQAISPNTNGSKSAASVAS